MARPLLAAALAALLLAAPAGAKPPAERWLAGDLHVHSTYSHDSYGGPGDDNTGPRRPTRFGFPVLGQFALAAARGLDFLAITDHNDVRSQSDPGFGAVRRDRRPRLRELARRPRADARRARGSTRSGDTRSAADVQALADALRADGGVFQINHPANSRPTTPTTSTGRSATHVVPDTVEAWNGAALLPAAVPVGELPRRRHPLLGGLAGPRRARRADRRQRHALGGDLAGAQGVGPADHLGATPQDRTRRGRPRRAARRAARSVSHQPPALRGPRLFLEADGDRDGTYEAHGRRHGARRLAAARAGPNGAPGTQLRLVTDGGERGDRARARRPRPRFAQRFRAARRAAPGCAPSSASEDARDARREHCPRRSCGAYCRNRLLVLAMTSATYLEPGA